MATRQLRLHSAGATWLGHSPPGYGRPLLASAQLIPAAVEETSWANGTVPLRITAHTRVAELPDELVLSVRCIVLVGDEIVVCSNRDGISHPWAGGRREEEETLIETACREVHEETGWLVNPDSLRPIGWLHFEHLREQPDDHPWPHPDFLQVVYTGRSSDRDGGGPDVEWTDTEGYELSSRLMSVDEAAAAMSGDRLAMAFLSVADMTAVAQPAFEDTGTADRPGVPGQDGIPTRLSFWDTRQAANIQVMYSTRHRSAGPAIRQESCGTGAH